MVTKNRWCALIQININQKNLQRMKYERDGKEATERERESEREREGDTVEGN